MLEQIGTAANVPAFLKRVKEGEGDRLMGFGHRIYKNYDPRCRSASDLGVSARNKRNEVGIRCTATTIAFQAVMSR